MALPTDVHILQAPFVYSHLILAEHPLARARHVGENDIEEMSQLGEVGRIIVGHYHLRMPPLDEVLGQDLRAVTHHFIRHQQAAFRQSASAQSRFPSRCGTEVEHHHRLMHIFTEHPFDKHRRGFLHVIASGMEKGVERERRSALQVYARCSPRNRLALDGELALRAVGTDADRHFVGEFFR